MSVRVPRVLFRVCGNERECVRVGALICVKCRGDGRPTGFFEGVIQMDLFFLFFFWSLILR